MHCTAVHMSNEAEQAVWVQWNGLPYGECTWESFQDISKAGGQHRIDEFQVSSKELPPCRIKYSTCL